jgi:bifunctional N-acetylglucosamine-1-phosphate-uridyltransferase/glucosamine-1-phosphate-acetyltransferase GlmU-like protein
MNIFRAFVCFFLPSCVIRLISKIIRSKKIVLGKNAKIGFSFIVAESIVMDDNTSVGHFNYVNIKRLHFEKGGSIKHLNFIKGDFSIFIGEKPGSVHKIKYLRLVEHIMMSILY